MTKYELYWAQREQENLLENIMDTDQIAAEIAAVNNKAYLEAQDQLYAWYGKYGDANGITIEQAKLKAQIADIKELSKKAKEYIATHDVSPEANAAMTEYNFAMKTSRLELLQNQIRMAYFEATDQQEKILKEKLGKVYTKTLTRQAGIMGQTLYTDAEARRLGDFVAKSSYRGNTFSERIWTNNQDMMKNELDRALRQGILQGKNPAAQAKALAKLHGRKQSDAERLLRTEGARVRAQARSDSFKRAGYTHFKWVPRGNPCKHCLEKVKQSEAQPFLLEVADQRGEMPPLHPYCYCSTAPVEPEENILSKDAIDADFEKQWQAALNGDADARAHFERLYQNTATPDWKQFKLEDAAAKAKAATPPPPPPPRTTGARIRTPGNTPRSLKYIDDKIDQVMHQYKLPAKEAAEFADELTKMIDNSAYAMRVPDESILNAILDEGRFKNQMETGSSRGTFSPSTRKGATSDLFAVPRDEVNDFSKAEFEKYGFFSTKDPTKKPAGRMVASQYGEVLIRFKEDQVADFATMTIDDSLSFRYGGAVPTKRPSAAALDIRAYDYNTPAEEFKDTLREWKDAAKKTGGSYNPEDMARNIGARYMEVQYHGELTTDYIQSVSVSAGQLSPETIKRLKDKGIDVYVGYKKV